MTVLAGKRILVVEDEALLAFALEDMLLDMGCLVVGPAVQLKQAMVLAQSEAIDAAILDININSGRSYNVAHELSLRSVPYLFATGYGAEGLDANHASAPVLSKPYRQDALEVALARLLGPQLSADPKRSLEEPR